MERKNSSKTIKDSEIEQFLSLNQQCVSVEYGILGEKVLVSKIHPNALVLPEGWRSSEELQQSKNDDSGKPYSTIPLLKPNGGLWPLIAFLG